MRPGAAGHAKPIRTENDLSMSVVIIGSLLIMVCMFLFLEFKPVPGAFVGWAANLAASLLVVVFGFLCHGSARALWASWAVQPAPSPE